MRMWLVTYLTPNRWCQSALILSQVALPFIDFDRSSPG
jgi:hypothetical protein